MAKLYDGSEVVVTGRDIIVDGSKVVIAGCDIIVGGNDIVASWFKGGSWLIL